MHIPHAELYRLYIITCLWLLFIVIGYPFHHECPPELLGCNILCTTSMPMSVSWADKSYTVSYLEGIKLKKLYWIKYGNLSQCIVYSLYFSINVILSLNCNMMSCHCLNTGILVIKIPSLVYGISHCCPEMVLMPSIAFNVGIMALCHTMINLEFWWSGHKHIFPSHGKFWTILHNLINVRWVNFCRFVRYIKL